jgi:hypothetical protein
VEQIVEVATANPSAMNILFVLLRLASTAAFILVGLAKDRASG